LAMAELKTLLPPQHPLSRRADAGIGVSLM
jgi:hypothetical protein